MALQIMSGRDLHGCQTAAQYRDWLAATAQRIRSQPGGLVMAVDPAGIGPASNVDANARPAIAKISTGRWVADCPNNDGHAYDVAPPDRMSSSSLGALPLFCVYCGNADIGGAWRPVLFPPFWAALEALLSQRRFRHHQNWIGEPLAIVEAEQAAGRNL